MVYVFISKKRRSTAMVTTSLMMLSGMRMGITLNLQDVGFPRIPLRTVSVRMQTLWIRISRSVLSAIAARRNGADAENGPKFVIGYGLAMESTCPVPWRGKKGLSFIERDWMAVKRHGQLSPFSVLLEEFDATQNRLARENRLMEKRLIKQVRRERAQKLKKMAERAKSAHEMAKSDSPSPGSRVIQAGRKCFGKSGCCTWMKIEKPRNEMNLPTFLARFCR
eukprot:symbB.v1.2.023202.t2/scaffold2101.1/size89465/3